MMNSRAATPGAAAQWQLAVRFEGRLEPKYLRLIPTRAVVIPLAVSQFENSRRIDGIPHNASRPYRVALIRKARDHF
jgi:hypothetical protein